MSARIQPNLPILLVDDEQALLNSCRILLESAGYSNIVTMTDSRRVVDFLAGNEVCLVALDLMMPHVEGRSLLPILAADYPNVPIIVLTGVGEVETAVECMKNGAFDYILKPIKMERFVNAVGRAIEFGMLRHENAQLKRRLFCDKLESPEAFQDIITQSRAMHTIFQYIESIAQSAYPVMITGETGVGKELIAKAVHKLSGLEGEFVAVNLAGLDDTLLSDTLFGHRKGAFSGADNERLGLIERANGGTLFLDEIGDLSKASQVKLLRLLQEREYYPIGSDVPRLSNARIIAATHQDLRRLQETGQFRKDLYYRLETHQVHVPPLRERMADIPVLVDHFLGKVAGHLGRRKPTPPRELFSLLGAYHFPGNIRELEGLVSDAVSRHNGKVLSMNSFKEKISRNRKGNPPGERGHSIDLDSRGALCLPANGHGNFPTLKEAERFLIDEAMKQANHNQTVAAELLGLSRSALNKRLNRA